MDDHASVRLGLGALLDSAEDVSLVGAVADEPRALQVIEERAPDVLVLDLRLRGGADGLTICRRAREVARPPRVLIHTALEDSESMTMSALAGADGYVSKGSDPAALVEAIKRVSAGERVWLNGLNEGPRTPDLLAAQENVSLTPKEREVYALKLRRRSNNEIAGQLFISERTVKSHVSSIMRKLGAKGRGSLG